MFFGLYKLEKYTTFIYSNSYFNFSLSYDPVIRGSIFHDDFITHVMDGFFCCSCMSFRDFVDMMYFPTDIKFSGVGRMWCTLSLIWNGFCINLRINHKSMLWNFFAKSFQISKRILLVDLLTRLILIWPGSTHQPNSTVRKLHELYANRWCHPIIGPATCYSWTTTFAKRRLWPFASMWLNCGGAFSYGIHIQYYLFHHTHQTTEPQAVYRNIVTRLYS